MGGVPEVVHFTATISIELESTLTDGLTVLLIGRPPDLHVCESIYTSIDRGSIVLRHYYKGLEDEVE